MQSRVGNLSPMQFLQGFNRMIDDLDKTEAKFRSTNAANDFKLTPLKRFPIPPYYSQMQGLNVNTKEKEEQEKIKANKFNKADQEFKRKHNSFMRKTLNTMIENNIKHMNTLQKGKAFYNMKATNREERLQRTLSMVSADRIRKEARPKENVEQTQEVFPDINFKSVDKKRIKSPYMISFHPSSSEPKLKSKSVVKVRETSNMLMQLEKRRQSITNQRTQTLMGSRQCSKQGQSVSARRFDRLLTKDVLLAQPKQSDLGDRNEQVDILLDTQRYIKSRFSSLTSNTDYQQPSKLKQASEAFKKRVVFHYANDYNNMK